MSAPGTSIGCAPRCGPAMPVLIVPELFTRATGRRVVSLMAQSIHDELV